MDKAAEFRGCRNLCYAHVLKDTLEEFLTDEVKKLAPLAEIAKTTETATETRDYDNVPMITINAEGADTVTAVVPALDIETYSDILGKDVDEETGALMDGEAEPRYIALGYILDMTDNTSRYVWRYKCSVTVPDEASVTKKASIDVKNQTLKITGISTTYKFLKPGKQQKALVVDERDGKADLSTFFKQVTTIDTLKPKTTPVE